MEINLICDVKKFKLKLESQGLYNYSVCIACGSVARFP